MVTALLAILVFGEHLAPLQWTGLAVLSGGIALLALANLRDHRRRGIAPAGLQLAIMVALMTGFMIAIYTTLDAYGIRQAQDPFTFLAWFFFMGGFGFPVIAWFRLRRLASLPSYRDLVIRGFSGAIVAYVSFGAVMLATRLGKVGEAAALRETSIIFATAIGVFIFKERIDATRLAIIALIAAGAVLVEFG
jgi:drug/metabolite transporter (DMT)-like permease